MGQYAAKVKLGDGNWFDIVYGEDVYKKLEIVTSWDETVDLFKPLVQEIAAGRPIMQINLECVMELKRAIRNMRMKEVIP